MNRLGFTLAATNELKSWVNIGSGAIHARNAISLRAPSLHEPGSSSESVYAQAASHEDAFGPGYRCTETPEKIDMAEERVAEPLRCFGDVLPGVRKNLFKVRQRGF